MNLACLSGYFGTNCSTTCPYPYYGKFCEKACHCNAIDCDHAFGCQRNNLEIETAIGWYMFKDHFSIMHEMKL